MPRTAAEAIWNHVYGMRNGVQDIAVALFASGERDPEKLNEIMNSPPMIAFRRQVQNLTVHTVTEISKELRQLNAVAPCSRCNVTGKLVEMGGQRTCPTCRGTCWEPLV